LDWIRLDYIRFSSITFSLIVISCGQGFRCCFYIV